MKPRPKKKKSKLAVDYSNHGLPSASALSRAEEAEKYPVPLGGVGNDLATAAFLFQDPEAPVYVLQAGGGNKSK